MAGCGRRINTYMGISALQTSSCGPMAVLPSLTSLLRVRSWYRGSYCSCFMHPIAEPHVDLHQFPKLHNVLLLGSDKAGRPRIIHCCHPHLGFNDCLPMDGTSNAQTEAEPDSALSAAIFHGSAAMLICFACQIGPFHCRSCSCMPF